MAPCSGKAKCGCGCPKKKKVVRKKAPAKARPQFGGPVMQSYPGIMGTQFTPSLMTPIPSAVSKITGDSIVKKQTAEIGTQTKISYTNRKKKETPKPSTVKKSKKIVVMPVEEKPPRAISKAGIAAIARSESVRPLQRVNNVVSFAPQVEQSEAVPAPATVADIKPRGRSLTERRKPGPKPKSKALGENALPGVQTVIQPSQVSLAPQARQK
jgi:hypothetical protein